VVFVLLNLRGEQRIGNVDRRVALAVAADIAVSVGKVVVDLDIELIRRPNSLVHRITSELKRRTAGSLQFLAESAAFHTQRCNWAESG
jgi:hypothetical protein